MSSSSTRHSVRTHGPIVLFIFLTLVGSAVIWFGKVWDFNIELITAVPVSMMFLYLAVNMLPGLRVHNEQAGDNLYYMGFIFTLTSLGVSLFKFTGQASIEDVVRNFGIAIISTVTGIALRIFFNQMRRDPVDIEKAVRQELSEMTRRVRTELDSSAMEFSSYRRTSNQMLSEGFEEIARQAEKNGEAVRSAIESMSAKAVESIEATAKRLLATLEESHASVASLSEANAKNVVNLSDQMQAVATSMTEKSKLLAEAIDVVIAKYAAARSPDEVLRVDVSPAVDALRQVVDTQARTIVESSASTRDTAKKILAAIAPFKQTAAGLPKLTAEIGLATAAQKQSSEDTAKLSTQVGVLLEGVVASNQTRAANDAKLSQLIDSVAARNSEAKVAEEHNRAVGERIERSLAQVAREREPVRSAGDSLNGHHPDQLEGFTSIETGPSEDDKPRRSWWQR